MHPNLVRSGKRRLIIGPRTSNLVTAYKGPFIYSGTGVTELMIDVPRILSMANHRFYRQGHDYRVRITMQPQADHPEPYIVSCIAPTWWNRSAYNMGKKMWIRQVRAACRLQPKQPLPKWLDFRVYMYYGQPSVSYPSVMTFLEGDSLPTLRSLALAGMSGTINDDAAPSASAEFPASVLVDQSSNTYELYMFGDSDTSTNYYYSLQYEHDRSHQIKSDDTILDADSDDVPYRELYDDNLAHLEFIKNLLETHGDEPPYDKERLEPIMRYVKTLHTTAEYGVFEHTTGWFDAPLGLVHISMANSIDGHNLRVEVARGKHKGVKALRPFSGVL